MTVEEIVRDLINGEDIHLKEGEIYDFTGYHSIPCHSNIYGNGATITCSNFYENGVNGVENSSLTFLFNAFTGSSFENLTIEGPNGGLGSTNYTKVWGAINIIEDTFIRNCTFKGCDKWAVRVESKGPITRTSWIEDSTFIDIKRQGYGYGIWNSYGDGRVLRCKFINCRHGIDISSQRACYIIKDCEFDKSNYIHINMHGYGVANEMTTGDRISISNCNFYDNMQPLKLKLPYTLNGFLEVSSCNFLVSEDKVGLIANDQVIRGFSHPKFVFKNNTFNGEAFLKAPIIEGPSEVKCGELFSIFTQSYSSDEYDFYWEGTCSNIQQSKFEYTTYNPNIQYFSLYVVNKKTKQRSLRSEKVVIVRDEYPFFKFAFKGMDATIEVLKNGEVIDTIVLLNESYHYWRTKEYSYDGKYELRLSGSGYVLLDDWLESNSNRVFFTTFETDYKIKFTYNSIKTIKVQLLKGESFTGNGCLRVTLNDQGNIVLKNNVDK